MTCTCEQRTCENCKHWERRQGEEVGVCKKLKISESGANAFGSFSFVRKGDYIYPSNTLTTSVFGCVYFEEKITPTFIVAHGICHYVVCHKDVSHHPVYFSPYTDEGQFRANEMAQRLNELWQYDR